MKKYRHFLIFITSPSAPVYLTRHTAIAAALHPLSPLIHVPDAANIARTAETASKWAKFHLVRLFIAGLGLSRRTPKGLERCIGPVHYHPDKKWLLTMCCARY
jgi:hypothetical protein